MYNILQISLINLRNNENIKKFHMKIATALLCTLHTFLLIHQSSISIRKTRINISYSISHQKSTLRSFHSSLPYIKKNNHNSSPSHRRSKRTKIRARFQQLRYNSHRCGRSRLRARKRRVIYSNRSRFSRAHFTRALITRRFR